MSRLVIWIGVAALVLGTTLLVLPRSGLWPAPEQPASWTPFYKLRVRTGEVKSAQRLVARAIATEMSRTLPFEDGYPREGRVEMVDSGEGPGIKRMTCIPSTWVGERRGCLLLDAEGDLVEIGMWDQPNALFFPYVLYLLEPGARLDFGETPRVTVRFNSDPNKRSLLLLHQVVEKALLGLGATPFSWK